MDHSTVPARSGLTAWRPGRLDSLAVAGMALGSVLLLTALSPLVSRAIEATVPPGTISAQLRMGTTLFRVALGVLGLTVAGLAQLPIWRAPALPVQAHLKSRQTGALILVVALVLVAGVLRLYQLNAGMWHDEILTTVLYARSPWGAIVTTFDSENQHFLYTLLAHGSISLFGETAWALRLPAAIFGVGSIWAVYLLGREISGVREGFFAAALLTVSYTHIWFSQNARGYSGLLFWTLFSSYWLLRALREARPGLWVAYAVTTALGLYTHFTMAFVCLGQFAVFVVAAANRPKLSLSRAWPGLVLGFGLAGLLTLQLYALVLPQMLTSMGREPSLVPAWKNPLWTLLEVAQGLQLSFRGGIVALAALAVFALGLWGLAQRRWEILLLTLIPPVTGAAVVVALGHHLWPRFFFFAMGFGALIVVHGAMRLGQLGESVVPRLPGRLRGWLGPALALGLIVVAGTSIPFAYGAKQDFQGGLDYVQTHQQPGDIVVTAGLAEFAYGRYYLTGWPEVKSAAELEAVRSQATRTWVVYTLPTVLASVSPDLMALIQRDFEIVATFPGTVNDGDIVVCRADGSGAIMSTATTGAQ